MYNFSNYTKQVKIQFLNITIGTFRAISFQYNKRSLNLSAYFFQNKIFNFTNFFTLILVKMHHDHDYKAEIELKR